jgi:quinol monooxygenase YgiN
MHVIHVHVHVLADAVEAFRQATLVNAEQSLKEHGVARFDVLQQQDDPARFVLVEAYRTAEAIAAHKGTAHYAAWRNTVAALMAEPRRSTKYINLFPDDTLFSTPQGGR